MKRHNYITHSALALSAAAAFLFAAGCGKQETPATEPPKASSPSGGDKPAPAETPKPVAEPAPPAAAATPAPAAPATPVAAPPPPSAAASLTQQAIATATTQATAAASAATNQVQALIDKAKGLVTDQKYKDALTTLQQLSNMKLTDEQQKIVDSLKGQIQTALANTAGSNAVNSLNSILGGKK